MQKQQRRVVADGYDAMAEDFSDWSRRVLDPTRDRFFEEFRRLLPDCALVLDLGCGSGLPWTKRLAADHDVVGVDISPRQIALARRNVPKATFIEADMATLPLLPASVSAVTALYSIPHLPRFEHAGLFRSVALWLEPEGLFLASLGASDSPAWTGEWLGVPMFFSSFDADANRALLRDAGFELLADEVAQVAEPEGTVEFLWVLARKR